MLTIATLLACSEPTASHNAAHLAGRPDREVGDWVAVGVGGATGCALDRVGRAYCWGYNYGGGLGTVDTASRVTTPTAVAGLPGAFHALATGHYHRCALTAEGRAYCWGANEHGQLGTGVVTPVEAGGQITAPALVAGGSTFRALTAGLAHTCGLTEDGAAYCWGDAASGQLGAGAAATTCDPAGQPLCAVPAPVRVAGGMRFTQLSAGRRHTCAVTSDGTAYCWGNNAAGQLGDPDVPVQCGPAGREACSRDEPVAVAGGLRFVQISAGASHSCGVTTSGAAYCWGLATGDVAIGAAELGNASYSGYHGAERGSRLPVPVEGGLTFRAVSAGNRGSCGHTTHGQAVCWGSNNFGQMGVGGARPDFSTTPRVVWMPAAVGTPALGEEDNVCAATTSGRIFCWGGYNFDGEIGSAPVSERGDLGRWFLRGTPMPVSGPAAVVQG